ncbi:hypothetical protein DPMN_181295 [Dreissena polymorpha]|uniref:Uncharacterized protein n=1 Tax=Dreissena polymorpha TaxID=45954 RepID=A0A9D4DDW5_DREPO|nr:hypothetical protein DPMN_181295 [Dreissena polymorpha]
MPDVLTATVFSPWNVSSPVQHVDSNQNQAFNVIHPANPIPSLFKQQPPVTDSPIKALPSTQNPGLQLAFNANPIVSSFIPINANLTNPAPNNPLSQNLTLFPTSRPLPSTTPPLSPIQPVLPTLIKTIPTSLPQTINNIPNRFPMLPPLINNPPLLPNLPPLINNLPALPPTLNNLPTLLPTLPTPENNVPHQLQTVVPPINNLPTVPPTLPSPVNTNPTLIPTVLSPFNNVPTQAPTLPPFVNIKPTQLKFSPTPVQNQLPTVMPPVNKEIFRPSNLPPSINTLPFSSPTQHMPVQNLPPFVPSKMPRILNLPMQPIPTFPSLAPTLTPPKPNLPVQTPNVPHHNVPFLHNVPPISPTNPFLQIPNQTAIYSPLQLGQMNPVLIPSDVSKIPTQLPTLSPLINNVPSLKPKLQLPVNSVPTQLPSLLTHVNDVSIQPPTLPPLVNSFPLPSQNLPLPLQNVSHTLPSKQPDIPNSQFQPRPTVVPLSSSSSPMLNHYQPNRPLIAPSMPQPIPQNVPVEPNLSPISHNKPSLSGPSLTGIHPPQHPDPITPVLFPSDLLHPSNTANQKPSNLSPGEGSTFIPPPPATVPDLIPPILKAFPFSFTLPNTPSSPTIFPPMFPTNPILNPVSTRPPLMETQPQAIKQPSLPLEPISIVNLTKLLPVIPKELSFLPTNTISTTPIPIPLSLPDIPLQTVPSLRPIYPDPGVNSIATLPPIIPNVPLPTPSEPVRPDLKQNPMEPLPPNIIQDNITQSKLAPQNPTQIPLVHNTLGFVVEKVADSTTIGPLPLPGQQPLPNITPPPPHIFPNLITQPPFPSLNITQPWGLPQQSTTVHLPEPTKPIIPPFSSKPIFPPFSAKPIIPPYPPKQTTSTAPLLPTVTPPLFLPVNNQLIPRTTSPPLLYPPMFPPHSFPPTTNTTFPPTLPTLNGVTVPAAGHFLLLPTPATLTPLLPPTFPSLPPANLSQRLPPHFTSVNSLFDWLNVTVPPASWDNPLNTPPTLPTLNGVTVPAAGNFLLSPTPATLTPLLPPTVPSQPSANLSQGLPPPFTPVNWLNVTVLPASWDNPLNTPSNTTVANSMYPIPTTQLVPLNANPDIQPVNAGPSQNIPMVPPLIPALTTLSHFINNSPLTLQPTVPPLNGVPVVAQQPHTASPPPILPPSTLRPYPGTFKPINVTVPPQYMATTPYYWWDTNTTVSYNGSFEFAPFNDSYPISTPENTTFYWNQPPTSGNKTFAVDVQPLTPPIAPKPHKSFEPNVPNNGMNPNTMQVSTTVFPDFNSTSNHSSFTTQFYTNFTSNFDHYATTTMAPIVPAKQHPLLVPSGRTTLQAPVVESCPTGETTIPGLSCDAMYSCPEGSRCRGGICCIPSNIVQVRK